MRYLDEDLIIIVTGFTAPVSQTYQYVIQVRNDDGLTYTTLFNGNCFLTSGQTSKTFYVNDILNSNGIDYNVPVNSYKAVYQHSLYVVRLYIGNAAYSTAENVILAYRYPNRKAYLEKDLPYRTWGSYFAYNYIQGDKLPRIPYVSSAVFPFVECIQFSTNFEAPFKYYYGYEGAISGTDKDVQTLQYRPNTLYSNPLSTLFSSTSINTQYDGDSYLTFNLQMYSSITRTWQLNITGSTTTAQTVSAITMINGSKTDYNIRRASSYVDVYAGNKETYLGRFSIEGEGTKTIEIDYANFGRTDAVLTLHFKYASGTRDSEGYIYLHSGDFDRTFYNFNIKFNKVAYYSTQGGLDGYNIHNLEVYTQNHPSLWRDKIFNAAQIDVCPEKHYLIWKDRLGSYQSQPFEKQETYSEELSRDTRTDYKGHTSIYHAYVLPKWKLNTGWISEHDMPYYESIYCSPVVKLYDTKEDKIYDVNVTDSTYTEKTVRNQSRKLFNIELNVELDKKQQMIN